MSQPEISRRCLSCGASVRAGARFCPQCGASVKDGAHATPDGNQKADDAASVREAAPEAPSRREVVNAFETWREDARPPSSVGVEAAGEHEPLTDSAALSSVEESPPTRPEAARQEAKGGGAATPSVPAARRGDEHVDEGVGDSNVSAAGREPGVEAARRRRAGVVVKENIMPRVERMREEALVVLEETPDDAGLRFVAAAVVLFLLFLLFLFLSTALK